MITPGLIITIGGVIGLICTIVWIAIDIKNKEKKDMKLLEKIVETQHESYVREFSNCSTELIEDEGITSLYEESLHNGETTSLYEDSLYNEETTLLEETNGLYNSETSIL